MMATNFLTSVFEKPPPVNEILPEEILSIIRGAEYTLLSMAKATGLFKFLIVVFSHDFLAFSLNVTHNVGSSGFSISACASNISCSFKVLPAVEIQ